MKNEPLVSVVIIFLNMKTYLEEAVESVIAQTYPNWELWLVDDGSTDGSTNIAKKYVQQYPSKIHYIDHLNHENHGMSASRNLGISQCSGEYLALLDADDIWLPTKLEKQLQVLEAHPEAGMVYGPTYYWHSWTKTEEHNQRDYIKDLGVKAETLYKPPTLLKALLKNGGVIPGNCSILTKMDIIKQVKGFEENFRSIYEDQVFFAKVCLNTPVFVSQDCVARYRQHPDSACYTAEVAGSYHPENPNPYHLTFLVWLKQYLENTKIEDASLRRTLRFEFLKYRNFTLYKLLKLPGSFKKKLEILIRSLARRVIPRSLYNLIKSKYRGDNYIPGVGFVRFGNLRRLNPINQNFGFDRGQPVDRYYIETFLDLNSKDIYGKTLEIGDNEYTLKYGGNKVSFSEVLHVEIGNPYATMVGDLTDADFIPSDSFDCVILTQTLQLIYEPQKALQTVLRILKPGGVLLATFPGITHIGDQTWQKSWYWNFTTHSAITLFSEVFGAQNVTIDSKGNVLAAISFLEGLCAAELTPEELDYNDPNYQVLITARVVKGSKVG